MKTNRLVLLIAFFTSIFVFDQTIIIAQESNWTHFRGSNLDGISAENVPVFWNDTTNVIWKTEIRGKGWSSPVVYGNQVWVTTATVDGKEMSGICVDFKSGKVLYDILLFKQDSIYRKHSINTYATPTPCIEQGFVYMNFGSSGTACVNTLDGKIIWKRDDLKVEHVQGTGASPILYKDLLILHFEGTDQQFIVALNKRTGETIWRTDRPSACYDLLLPIGKKAYITPIVVNVAGKDLLISNGSAVCIAYDIQTGKEIWRVVQGEDSTIAMPVTEDGVIFFYTSFVTPANGEKYVELLAVDPKGAGDVTKSHVLWRFKGPILQLLTPLVKDGIIYTVDSQNNLIAIDAKTGSSLYTKRLKNKYNSSPVYAGGRIYFTSVKGETLVLKVGRTLEILAENKLPGELYATPAIAQNSILIRNESTLYRIGER
ncbi:MAG: PQQ-binding-like beta-propeller repeat protein [Bacteroidia bacterium]|nr:PQQ-binding-like beta-propeller repeat protein [Bacteroidia bacterium]